MSHPVKGVDHIFLLVPDLDAAAAAYRRLGFTLSPRGAHSGENGSANHTLILEHDYFELLGVLRDTPANLPQRETLARDGGGLHAIACRIEDAHTARRDLEELGIQTGPVTEFSRPVPLPDGTSGVAAFASTRFAQAEIPAGLVFMCEHRTPDLVWRPELRSHPNGAQALAGIVAVMPDPERAAAGFARLFAAGRVCPAEGGYSVATGTRSAPILCLTPDAAATFYSADAIAGTPRSGFAVLRIAVANLDRTRALLGEAGVPLRDRDRTFWAGPGDAGGTILEFVEGNQE